MGKIICKTSIDCLFNKTALHLTQHWTGFTDANHSYMGYAWNLWFWALMNCKDPTAGIEEQMEFVITEVEIFSFVDTTTYETGANIYVHEST